MSVRTASVLLAVIMTGCTQTPNVASGPTSQDVAQARAQGRAQGYEEGYGDGLKVAASRLNKLETRSWEEGNAYTCNMLYGLGKPSPDGWRSTLENYGQDVVFHKATVLYWADAPAEVPMPVSRGACLSMRMPGLPQYP